MTTMEAKPVISETVFNLELSSRTTVKAELHEHMLKSVLKIGKEAHDKFCGLKPILNAVHMVFDIITSIIKFDTVKVDYKTYLDSNYSGKHHMLRNILGSGDKQCVFGRVQGLIRKSAAGAVARPPHPRRLKIGNVKIED